MEGEGVFADHRAAAPGGTLESSKGSREHRNMEHMVMVSQCWHSQTLMCLRILGEGLLKHRPLGPTPRVYG